MAGWRASIKLLVLLKLSLNSLFFWISESELPLLLEEWATARQESRRLVLIKAASRLVMSSRSRCLWSMPLVWNGQCSLMSLITISGLWIEEPRLARREFDVHARELWCHLLFISTSKKWLFDIQKFVRFGGLIRRLLAKRCRIGVRPVCFAKQGSVMPENHILLFLFHLLWQLFLRHDLLYKQNQLWNWPLTSFI